MSRGKALNIRFLNKLGTATNCSITIQDLYDGLDKCIRDRYREKDFIAHSFGDTDYFVTICQGYKCDSIFNSDIYRK